MQYYGAFGWIVFFTMVQCAPQVRWTLFTKTKCWIEAQMVCSALGGHLATPMSDTDKTAMEYFIDNDWKSKVGITTLFMGIGRAYDDNELRWTNCSEIFNVWSKNSMFASKDCGGVVHSMISKKNTIASARCYDAKRRYICEKEELSSCPYDYAQGTPTISSTNYPSITNAALCQQTCTDLSECRAYTFSTDCNIYSDPDPMVFANGANMGTGSTEVYIKSCYLSDLNEEDIDVTSPASFSGFPNTCGGSTAAVTVYMIFSHPITWAEASQACSEIHGTLAIINTTTKFTIVKELLRDLNMEYHWVGYEEIIEPQTDIQWITGESLSDVTGEEPPLAGTTACGTTHLWTGEKKLHDCQATLPFVCQLEMGQCFYSVTPGHSVAVGFTNHGKKSIDECQTVCESNRDLGGGYGCYAFVTKQIGSISNQDCLTKNFASWEESFITAESWTTSNSLTSLWRYTCVTVSKHGEYLAVIEETSSTTLMTTDSVSTTTIALTTVPIATTSTTYSPSSTNSASTTAIATTTFSFTTASTQQTTTTSTSALSTTTLPSSSTSASISTSSDSTVSTTDTSQSPSTRSYQSTTSELTTLSHATSETTKEPTMSTTPNFVLSSQQTQSNSTSFSPSAFELCRCPCTANMTLPSTSDFMEELASLHVPIDSTGAAYRKKNSIMDHRPSSNGLGTVACAFLAFTFSAILSFDVINLSARQRKPSIRKQGLSPEQDSLFHN